MYTHAAHAAHALQHMQHMHKEHTYRKTAAVTSSADPNDPESEQDHSFISAHAPNSRSLAFHCTVSVVIATHARSFLVVFGCASFRRVI